MSDLACESVVVIETKIMTTNEQLELGFNATASRIYGRSRRGVRPEPRLQSRRARARMFDCGDRKNQRGTNSKPET